MKVSSPTPQCLAEASLLHRELEQATPPARHHGFISDRGGSLSTSGAEWPLLWSKVNERQQVRHLGTVCPKARYLIMSKKEKE